jgi:glycerol kinase
MSAPLILSLDQGTSSSRALLVDEHGRVLASAARSFPQLYPQPGWVEHDPEAIWSSQLAAARAVIAERAVDSARIAAIGIANQRETAVVWERASGKPIANAIVWQCRRTAAICDALAASGAAALIRARTGLVIDAYFSATKFAWLLDNVPGARRRAERGELLCGTVDSWLIWRLTGGRAHLTDRSNASRTMLFNLETDDWDDELCDLLRVPPAMLPRVQPSSSDFGVSDAALFGRSIPVRGVAGDQQAALFGQGCVDGGCKCTYGTGAFVLRQTGAAAPPPPAGMLLTAAATTDSERAFAVEGSVFVAGAAVQWLRDGLGIIASAAEIEALAASVGDSAGVQFVPAFVGLGAPFWDQQARGTLIGLTRGTNKAHIARATLDAIALQVRAVIEAMYVDGPPGDLRVDGGAAVNDLLLQTQADLLGTAVVRPREIETTALGAAYLAGIGAGIWRDARETASLWRSERSFTPAIGADERETRYARWLRAVERARGWAEED